MPPRRVLLVTGGSRGIGAAVAKLAALRNYVVAVGYRASEGAATELVRAIEREGGKAKTFRADLSRPEAAEALIDSVCRELGPICALVNSAGIAGAKLPFPDLDPGEMQAVVGINLLGTAYCCRQAARRMAHSRGGSGGAIVNISSDAARTGGNQRALYAAAKAAVNVLTVTLARELAPEGVRVNAVSPGVIDTDQQASRSAEEVARLVNSIPLGRMGAAAEVAEAVLWLLSDQASYVTGAVLPVHGGR